mmetsp:Transcript_29423/g.43436  ORF Transcript_29423/g.43436 Transcript_29423/m.43436 type:complete len:92 (+) Transcript_29423:138-413(+)
MNFLKLRLLLVVAALCMVAAYQSREKRPLRGTGVRSLQLATEPQIATRPGIQFRRAEGDDDDDDDEEDSFKYRFVADLVESTVVGFLAGDA